MTPTPRERALRALPYTDTMRPGTLGAAWHEARVGAVTAAIEDAVCADRALLRECLKVLKWANCSFCTPTWPDEIRVYEATGGLIPRLRAALEGESDDD